MKVFIGAENKQPQETPKWQSNMVAILMLVMIGQAIYLYPMISRGNGMPTKDAIERAKDAEKEAAKANLNAKCNNWLIAWRDSGVMVKSEGSRYWFKPEFWARLNRDQKTDIIQTLSIYNASLPGKDAHQIVHVLSYADDSILGEIDWSGAPAIRR